jgi:glutamyl/glutaminyl-tRNA synthetase
MVEDFSIQDISRSAPIYNRKKLEWLNSFYIRGKEEGELSVILIPYLQKAGIQIDQIDRQWLNQIFEVLKENLIILSQVDEYLGIFFDEKFFFDDGAKTVLQEPKNRETLRSVLSLFEASPEITLDEQTSLLTQLEKKIGRKGKDLYAPLRAGVTGKTKGPELVKTLPLLGKEKIIRRLKMALETT